MAGFSPFEFQIAAPRRNENELVWEFIAWTTNPVQCID